MAVTAATFATGATGVIATIIVTETEGRRFCPASPGSQQRHTLGTLQGGPSDSSRTFGQRQRPITARSLRRPAVVAVTLWPQRRATKRRLFSAGHGGKPTFA